MAKRPVKKPEVNKPEEAKSSAIDQAAGSAAEAPQGGTVTVQIVGKTPMKYAIDKPMPLKEFLNKFSIQVRNGWRVYRGGSIMGASDMVDPGNMLTVGKLNKNG